MPEIFQDETVHIVCIQVHTFIVFFFGHKQPESDFKGIAGKISLFK